MNLSKCVLLRFQRKSVDWSLMGISGHYLLDGMVIPSKEAAMDLGIMVDISLKFHQHVANIVHKASRVAENILKSTVNREASFVTSLHHSYMSIIRVFFITVEHRISW